VRIEVTPADPDRPLVVRFAVNGVPHSASLDLSPARLASLSRPGRLVRPDGPEPPRLAPETGRPRRGPAPKLEDGTWKRSPVYSPTGTAGTLNSRDILVTGRLTYQRPDGVVVGADEVTVRVFDENPILNWLLGETTTGTDGTFALTVNWSQELHLEELPDLYIEFETRNDYFLTRSTFISPWGYTWRTGTSRDFEDFTYDLGTWSPADDAAALSVFSDMVRGWRWYDETLDLDLPQTIAIWPDNSGGVSFYVPFLREVHISTASQYNETTHAHEYAHGFMDWLGVWDDFDYCNGVCDPSADDCGHCAWCEESWFVGWQEGFPYYLAYLQTSSYASRYGVAADVVESLERVDDCAEAGGTFGDPWGTEGFTQALLQDIADGSNEADPNSIGERDRLSLGEAAILSLVVEQRPHTLYQFVNQLMPTLSPAQRWDLWATAENNRIELDTMNPPAPTGLTSTSHPVGSSSTDATPTFTWSYPVDDLSGPAGCEFSIEPTSTMTLVSGTTGYVTAFTTGIIVPGTWYFHLRTLDNSGRKSTGYATYGPFTIRAAEPINLQPTTPAGWATPLVPRPTRHAPVRSVPSPVALTGNTSGTYWNVAGLVGGEQWASAGLDARLLVDGAATALTTWSTAMAPGVTYSKVNLGPLTVRGGRHTFGVLHDAGEEFAEQSETDNDTSDQWIWSPYTLTSGTGVIRSAPPSRIGGWDALPPGFPAYYNCDGFRFASDANNGWWQAVYVTAHDVEEDYDCRMHFATASPDSGFGGQRAGSARPAGCLDAVLVNRNTVPAPTQWDVGVVNLSGGTGDFTVRQVTCGFLYVGDSVQVSLPTGEMLLLREFYVAPEQVGPVSLTARVVSGDGPVTLAWFDRLTTAAGLTQANGSATTEYMTTARLDLNLSTAGFYALALYRDAQDGTDWVNLLLEIETTPPDFVPYAGTGWHSPLVPRPAFDGTVSSVPAPDTLYGNVASTYLNLGLRNESQGPSPGFEDRLYLDGTYIGSLYYPAVGGWAWSLYNWDHAFTVPGGRHTLGSRLDPFALIEEIDEDDNVWGEQWVWSPYPLTMDVAVSRGAPPLRTGGWSEVTTPYTDLRYNCDGLRSPVFARSGEDGYWGAVAVAPGPASDVDVRLFELQPGTTAGFSAPRCASAWGPAQTDFALVNFNQTAFRAFDVGVVRAAGSESYRAEAVRSVYRAYPIGGLLGPFTMGAQHLLHLHEVYLPAGSYSFTVTPAAGEVDWGVSVHVGDGEFYGKSDSPDGGCAWLGEVSAPDRAWVTLPGGYHCVAVWKAMSGDATESGSYTLGILPQSTDAPPAVPVRTALAAAAPNPFRAATRVAFDLAAETDVTLEVYDVHGARVAVLASGRWPAGSHQVTWTGGDAAGRDLPAGVYLLRLVAGGQPATRKVVKVE